MSSWPKVRMDQCAEIISGGTPKTSEPSYWDGNIQWATPKDLSELDGAYISETARKITQSGLQSCAATILPPNSVMFSSRAPIGYVAINTVPMATNQGFKSFVPNHDCLDPKFLYHWLRKNRLYLEALGSGATFKEVSKTVVSRVEISLPPLSEQEQIAKVLDKADALRANRKTTMDVLYEFSQSIFLEIFGDPGGNPKGWHEVPISEATNGSTKWNPASKPNKEFVYIDISSIDRSKKEIIEVSKILGKDAPSRARQIVRSGDVLVSTVRPNLNAVALVPPNLDGATASTGFCVLRPKKRILTSYYLFALVCSNAFVTTMTRLATGASYPAVTDSIVRSWMTPIPPLDLQVEYDSRIERITHVQAVQKSSLMKFDELFYSLQEHAFQGDL